MKKAYSLIALIIACVMVFTGCYVDETSHDESETPNISTENPETSKGETSEESENPAEGSDEASGENSDETSEDDVSVPADHTHKYSNEWKSNATDHWKACDCGEKSEIGAHSFGEWTVTQEATEDANGSKYRDCDECGYKETVSIPMLSHTHSYSNEWKNNETDHWKECKCGNKNESATHDFGDWTITKEATEETEGSKNHTCKTCGYKETVSIPVLSHTHSFSDWKNNDTSHWKECKCGEKSELSAHTYGDWVVTNQATEETTGSRYHTCTVCGYKETEEIPVIPHTHSFGDWKNNDTSHWKECRCGEKSELSAHTYGDWVTITEATCTTTGSKKHTCTACGYSETATIPTAAHKETTIPGKAATCTEAGLTDGKKCSVCGTITLEQTTIDAKGHSMSNGTCTVCGYTVVVASNGLKFTLNSDGKSYSVTGIGTCTDLDVIIPSTYNGLPVTSISNSAFRGCNITGITIPKSVTSIDIYAFNSCENLQSMVVENGNKEYRSDGNCIIQNRKIIAGCKNSIIPPNTDFIGDRAFYGCTGLTSITIPDNITHIGTSAFESCTGLTSITIPKNVTYLGERVFSGCKGLTDVIIYYGVTNIPAKAFGFCTSLKNVTMSNQVISIGELAFESCTSLTSIEIPFYCDHIGRYAFAECTNLTSVTLPEYIDYIDEGAFTNCTSLTSIEIPNFVKYIAAETFKNCTSLTNVSISYSSNIAGVGNEAFANCTSLTSIWLPSSVTYIGDYAFKGCSSLTSITIPSQIKSINQGTFRDCIKLESIKIPTKVTKINAYAFEGCNSLGKVYYAGTESQWNKIDIGSGNTSLVYTTFYFNS